MSKFTHPICEKCFIEKNPGRDPVKLKDAGKEVCSNCGYTTNDGIFIRQDPKTVNFLTEEI